MVTLELRKLMNQLELIGSRRARHDLMSLEDCGIPGGIFPPFDLNAEYYCGASREMEELQGLLQM
jgi:hypothetical protein